MEVVGAARRGCKRRQEYPHPQAKVMRKDLLEVSEFLHHKLLQE